MDDLPLFARRLPVSDGQLNLLLPAGIGDNLFLWSRIWSLSETRKITAWLPAEEQHRSGPLFQMWGIPYGYLSGLSTNFVWGLRGDPPIPDTGATLAMHANAHVDSGFHLSRFYPDLPYKNPIPETNALIYKNVVGDPQYVVAFMCHKHYMGGSLMPGMWARLFRQIEKDIAPVLIVGADDDVPFIHEVCEIFNPTLSPVMNAPLDHVFAILKDAKMFVGVASGLSIAATYMGVRTFAAYPKHLKSMPGTFEPPESISDWCFVEDLPFVQEKILGLLDRSALGTTMHSNNGNHDLREGVVSALSTDQPVSSLLRSDL